MRYESNKTSINMNTATEEVRITPFLKTTAFSYRKIAPVVIVDIHCANSQAYYLLTLRNPRFSLSGEGNNN